ncbi:MAG: hypothetical protein ABII02_02375 [Candidatus Magasanikbacteria bacterium]
MSKQNDAGLFNAASAYWADFTKTGDYSVGGCDNAIHTTAY